MTMLTHRRQNDHMKQNRSASSSPSLCTPTPQEVIQMTGWQGEGMEGFPGDSYDEMRKPRQIQSSSKGENLLQEE